jgi:hypothetical protein
MHTINKDIARNRLIISLNGIIPFPEAIKIRDLIINAVADLQPGFDSINDLSKFIRGDDEAATVLGEVINYLFEKKVRRIVRIVGPSRTGLMQFAKYSPPDKNKIVKYVPTMEEAEKLLNEK